MKYHKINFPTMCIDNFYKDPHKIRDWALSLSYENTSGSYPGERTENLALVDEQFYRQSCSKLLSHIFDYKSEKSPKSGEIYTYFQKIYPYSSDPNDPLNHGAYHVDDSVMAAAVIYLNPDFYIESGTSFGKMMPSYESLSYDDELPEDFLKRSTDWNTLHKFYAGEITNEEDIASIKNLIVDHNNMFYPTIQINNNFNRMILYDGNQYHRQTNFLASMDNPRLTQVFFIKKFDVDITPLEDRGSYEI